MNERKRTYRVALCGGVRRRIDECEAVFGFMTHRFLSAPDAESARSLGLDLMRKLLERRGLWDDEVRILVEEVTLQESGRPSDEVPGLVWFEEDVGDSDS